MSAATRTQVASRTLAVAAAGLVLLLVNSGFTMLKEDPAFWRDAGGYPVALREMVLAGYYPLLGLNIMICGAIAAAGVYEHHVFGRCSWLAVTAGALMWTLLFLNIGLLTANNLENVLERRAVHYHPATPF